MNVWAVSKDHIRFHLNDVYMVSLMALWMIGLYAAYETFFMGHNMLDVFIVCLILIVAVIYAIKKQIGVDDKQFLKGMIPHHSMAIRMAQNIKGKTKDERIKVLAEQIIQAQTQEIEYMKTLGG